MGRLRRLDSPNGRAYVLKTKDGPIFMPSVTSILSLKPSQYLADLELKIGKTELQRIGNNAALRGTAMHLFLENYLICMKKMGNKDSCLLYTQRKSTIDLKKEMDNNRISLGRDLFYNIFHDGIMDNIEVISTEQFLYSIKYLFAGTTDLSYRDHEKLIVITDFKSASFERPPDVIEKFKCQVGAYSLGFEEMSGKKVDRGEIWISHKDGFQLEKFGGKEMEERKEEFLDLTSLYHSTWDVEPFKELYIK